MALSAAGVDPLVAELGDGVVTLEPAVDHTFVWTPADNGGRIRLTLNANSSGGHGSPYSAIIECDTDDAAGSLIVAGSLLAQFPETFDWDICAGTDCPPSYLTRYARSTVPVGDQDVELVIASEIAFGIEHHP